MIQVAKASTPLQTGIRLTRFGKFFADIFPISSHEIIGLRYVDGTGGKHAQAIRQVGRSMELAGRNIPKFFPIHSEQSTSGPPRVQVLPVVEVIGNRPVQFETHLPMLRLEEARLSSTTMISSV